MSLHPQQISCHSIYIGQNIKQLQLQQKRRIKALYIPKYREKLKMCKTQIYEPSIDRLSELTVKQIDRLVEIEKIKSLLVEQKKGIPPVHICSLQKELNRHPNVYQGNFLAKINKIAVKRNIKHLRSQQFDENVLTPSQRRKRGLLMQKKNLKFVKQYRTDINKNKRKTFEQLEEKSISSINQSVSEFEQNLEERKQSSTVDKQKILHKYKYKKTNILSATRWFNGMSTYYVNLNEKLCKNQVNKVENFVQTKRKQSQANTRDTTSKFSENNTQVNRAKSSFHKRNDITFQEDKNYLRVIHEKHRLNTCAY